MVEEKIDGLNKKLLKLREYVDLFRKNLDQYQGKYYDESNTRTDFIDKFFELLDWDVRNDRHFTEAYREVIREDKVTIQGKQKAPDYCFRIGGARKFFVEAKKPSVNIHEDISAAYQVRRYGYSAKLPLSILTDFDEFAVYDTRIKPRPKDRAEVARIFYWKFTDYEREFENIYNIFSKTAILKGSFDKFVSASKKKKGTSEVDKEFLKLIEGWRSDLAKNIAINNSKIDLYNLNAAVQKIIDRVIFLRIAEDRNIEEYNNLFKLAAGENVYKKLGEYFERSQKKYDSDLFVVESWLNNLKIDDKIFKDVIKSLYFPESPYEFSVLPVEILGNIYEQFLGKVITLTPSHQAKVEEKPEVKKAGGVYYTPQYIVEYIVKNTVGEKIKNLTPTQVEKIKILDPACGSGSFLIGAYDYLMNWHLAYYTDPKRKADSAKKGKIYHYSGDDFRLSVAEKKKILLNNIFGVDIDNQAVEVTKLSLLLKLMENETQESAGMLFKYSNEALLPDLKNNIKCGNSLIGPDFYEGKNMSLFGNEEMRKINVFDWEKEFKEIFAGGGFDVVVGNPPYIDSEEMVKSQEEERIYISHKYQVAKGNWDMYCVFSEKGLLLLREGGFFSFIIPNKFISRPYGEHLRRLFSEYNILDISDYSSVGVFVSNGKKISVYPVIIVINKIFNKKSGNYYKMEEDGSAIKIKLSKKIKIDRGEINWSQKFDPTSEIIEKIEVRSKKIGDYFSVESAATVSEAYEIQKMLVDGNFVPSEHFKFINTGTIDRYLNLWGIESTRYIKKNYKFPIISKEDLLKNFPKRFEQSKREKLILAGMVRRLEAMYDSGQSLAGKSTAIIVSKNKKISLKFLLALVNSKLYTSLFVAKNRYSSMAGGYLNVNAANIEEMSFPVVDLNNFEARKQYGLIVKFVDQMLEIQKKFHSAKTEDDKKLYQQKIDILDKQIDQEVYKLYGLSEGEIKTIERGSVG